MNFPAPGPSFWPRVLAAAVLVPTALAAVWVGGWILAIWTTAAGLAMSREWVRIVHRESLTGWHFGLHAAALAGSQALLALQRDKWALAAILVVALLGNVAARGRDERGLWSVAGVVYIALPCFALVWLRLQPHGFETVIWLFLVVWATDSAAYLAGSVFEGPKLAPAISPSKTWAGAVAGLAAGAVATIAWAQILGWVPAIPFVAVGLALAFLTQCGDLAESFLKRTFGVKDASDLIPGHGGALDRLDGMIFATLGLAAYVAWAGQSPIAWIAP